MLAVNHVVESVHSEAPFVKPARVLWLSRSADLITFMTLGDTFSAPWSARLTEIETGMAAGKLRLTSVRLPIFMLQPEEELSEKKKEFRKKCWDLVRPLLEGPDKDLLYTGSLGRLVAAHASKTGKRRYSIYRLLYRYWAFGLTPNAFLDKYDNCGAPGKPRQFKEGKKPGRPPKYLGELATESAKLLTEDDKAIIKIGFALYKNNKVKHITDAYVKTLNRFYRAEHPSSDGSDDGRPLRTLDQVPTLAQFTYWGKKAFDEIDIKRGRVGERKWAMDHRAIVGTAHQGLRGPCHRFEIDATIADIYLVSRFNRNWIIGRPIVYVVVDVFSRMIVGLHVGLEGPSWNIARHAVFNAFTDKVAFCASHGIAIKAEDWPCCHLPHELVADRGEMLGAAAEGIVSGLKVNLDILPPFRGDWKGTVESRFRILNNLTQIHWAPGGVRARQKERGERDYRLDATLDLREFTSILIKAVLHYNHHSRNSERLSKGMIEHGIDSTPIAIWNWSVEQGLVEPNIQSEEAIYLHLLPKAKATVRAGGIFFNGMAYANVLDPLGKRSARARANGREAIDIWHEPLADHIWIRDDDLSFIRCPLRDSETRFQDMRLEEVVDMLAITSAVSTESKYAELNSRVELDEFIESTVATAAAERKRTPALGSKASKIGNTRENRQAERDAERLLALERSQKRTGKPAGAKKVEEESNLNIAREYAGERSAEVIDLLSRAGKLGGKE